MIAKQILEGALRRIKHGALIVKYWDGTATKYGEGEPYFVVTISDPAALRAMLKNLTLGFGESYMNGQIEVEGDLENIGRILAENIQTFRPLEFTRNLQPRRANRLGTQQALVAHHYDIGNDFYKLWLDRSMTYSCAYFRSPDDSLEQAQTNKIDHILRKLQLSARQTLLDIGSGFGALCLTAARNYGVYAHGITLSREQYQHSVSEAKIAGLADKVSFELVNYQELAERGKKYDRVVSVGMFEHVGRANQATYFECVRRLLKPGAVSVLHTITNQVETSSDPWMDKYIFPGGYIPTVRQVVDPLPRYDFQLLDYENLRLHYALTLEEWYQRYESHRAEVIKMFDERFYRMWRLYLASSAAGFRYGDLSLSQFVFSNGINNDLPLTREGMYAPLEVQSRVATIQ
jgi:cyclopropane-fatty-acyl-phospholipid synthase